MKTDDYKSKKVFCIWCEYDLNLGSVMFESEEDAKKYLDLMQEETPEVFQIVSPDDTWKVLHDEGLLSFDEMVIKTFIKTD